MMLGGTMTKKAYVPRTAPLWDKTTSPIISQHHRKLAALREEDKLPSLYGTAAHNLPRHLHHQSEHIIVYKAKQTSSSHTAATTKRSASHTRVLNLSKIPSIKRPISLKRQRSSIHNKGGKRPINSKTSRLFAMDLDYFQHVAETSSATVRAAYRLVAIVAYGMIGSYVLTIAPPTLSAVAASDEYLE